MRAIVLIIALTACTHAASSELGLGDYLYVDGAQYRPGPFPTPTGGPAVMQAQSEHSTIVLGGNIEQLTGVLAPDATAAIVGIPGARGTWIVPAGPPQTETPNDASLAATFGLNLGLGPGPFELEVAAVDLANHIGAAYTLDLEAVVAPVPTGTLVVGLDWATTAELELHVVDPLGNDVWAGSPNSFQMPPPGTAVDPCEWVTGGIFDHDPITNCQHVTDPNEHVIWIPRMCGDPSMTYQPIIPSGTYTVRVDARSMCADASAAWSVYVTSQGNLLGTATGIAVPADVDDNPTGHGHGAGVTALTFTQP
jgi:hypothetical protein